MLQYINPNGFSDLAYHEFVYGNPPQSLYTKIVSYFKYVDIIMLLQKVTHSALPNKETLSSGMKDVYCHLAYTQCHRCTHQLMCHAGDTFTTNQAQSSIKFGY